MSPSDQSCEDLFILTTERNCEGRYIVSLLFKEGFPNSISLGNSWSMAMAQFFRNEARLNLKNNDKVVIEYEELHHMVKFLHGKFPKL